MANDCKPNIKVDADIFATLGSETQGKMTSKRTPQKIYAEKHTKKRAGKNTIIVRTKGEIKLLPRRILVENVKSDSLEDESGIVQKKSAIIVEKVEEKSMDVVEKREDVTGKYAVEKGKHPEMTQDDKTNVCVVGFLQPKVTLCWHKNVESLKKCRCVVGSKHVPRIWKMANKGPCVSESVNTVMVKQQSRSGESAIVMGHINTDKVKQRSRSESAIVMEPCISARDTVTAHRVSDTGSATKQLFNIVTEQSINEADIMEGHSVNKTKTTKMEQFISIKGTEENLDQDKYAAKGDKLNEKDYSSAGKVNAVTVMMQRGQNDSQSQSSQQLCDVKSQQSDVRSHKSDIKHHKSHVRSQQSHGRNPKFNVRSHEYNVRVGTQQKGQRTVSEVTEGEETREFNIDMDQHIQPKSKSEDSKSEAKIDLTCKLVVKQCYNATSEVKQGQTTKIEDREHQLTKPERKESQTTKPVDKGKITTSDTTKCQIIMTYVKESQATKPEKEGHKTKREVIEYQKADCEIKEHKGQPQANKGQTIKVKVKSIEKTHSGELGLKAKPEAELGQRAKPEAELGQRAKPQAEPGQRAKPQTELGQRAKHQAELGQRAKPQAEPGQRAKPEAELGQRAKPQAEPGQRAKPQTELGHKASKSGSNNWEAEAKLQRDEDVHVSKVELSQVRGSGRIVLPQDLLAAVKTFLPPIYSVSSCSGLSSKIQVPTHDHRDCDALKTDKNINVDSVVEASVPVIPDLNFMVKKSSSEALLTQQDWNKQFIGNLLALKPAVIKSSSIGSLQSHTKSSMCSSSTHTDTWTSQLDQQKAAETFPPLEQEAGFFYIKDDEEVDSSDTTATDLHSSDVDEEKDWDAGTALSELDHSVIYGFRGVGVRHSQNVYNPAKSTQTTQEEKAMSRPIEIVYSPKKSVMSTLSERTAVKPSQLSTDNIIHKPPSFYRERTVSIEERERLSHAKPLPEKTKKRKSECIDTRSTRLEHKDMSGEIAFSSSKKSKCLRSRSGSKDSTLVNPRKENIDMVSVCGPTKRQLCMNDADGKIMRWGDCGNVQTESKELQSEGMNQRRLDAAVAMQSEGMNQQRLDAAVAMQSEGMNQQRLDTAVAMQSGGRNQSSLGADVTMQSGGMKQSSLCVGNDKHNGVMNRLRLSAPDTRQRGGINRLSLDSADTRQSGGMNRLSLGTAVTGKFTPEYIPTPKTVLTHMRYVKVSSEEEVQPLQQLEPKALSASMWPPNCQTQSFNPSTTIPWQATPPFHEIDSEAMSKSKWFSGSGTVPFNEVQLGPVEKPKWPMRLETQQFYDCSKTMAAPKWTSQPKTELFHQLCSEAKYTSTKALGPDMQPFNQLGSKPGHLGLKSHQFYEPESELELATKQPWRPETFQSQELEPQQLGMAKKSAHACHQQRSKQPVWQFADLIREISPVLKTVKLDQVFTPARMKDILSQDLGTAKRIILENVAAYLKVSYLFLLILLLLYL